MPPVLPTSRILVTGANGFIAGHCIASLLSHNFQVVGTVRSSSKASQVLAQHSHNPLLTLEIVPDVTDLYAFDTAIASCDGVLHLAAPFGYSYTNFETELLIPSINGTKAVCLAASRTESVKRVVITSSFAAVFDAAKGAAPGKIYTEEDWSPLTYEDGVKAPITPIAYRASKVLAEKTAWEFVEKEKPGWDLVTLCPGMVFGSLLPGTISYLQQLNTSNGIVWGLFDAEKVSETKAPIWTSVITLADAHTAALMTASAGNQRFLVCNGDFDNQELADVIHASNVIPHSAKTRVPVGVPGDRLKGKVYSADSSKVERILGIDLKAESLEGTVEGLVNQLLKLEEQSRVSVSV